MAKSVTPRCPSRHREAKILAHHRWCRECGALKYVGPYTDVMPKGWLYPTHPTRRGA